MAVGHLFWFWLIHDNHRPCKGLYFYFCILIPNLLFRISLLLLGLSVRKSPVSRVLKWFGDFLSYFREGRLGRVRSLWSRGWGSETSVSEKLSWKLKQKNKNTHTQVCWMRTLNSVSSLYVESDKAQSKEEVKWRSSSSPPHLHSTQNQSVTPLPPICSSTSDCRLWLALWQPLTADGSLFAADRSDRSQIWTFSSGD